MAIIRWRNHNYQTTAFDQLRAEMNKLFQDFVSEDAKPYRTSIYPPVNLYENTDNLFLTAELPGLVAENIDINVESDRIQIKGERKIQSEGKDGHYHRRERESGIFIKKISLPTRINTNNVNAAMHKGVLTITMAKAEEAKPKKIQVKVG